MAFWHCADRCGPALEVCNVVEDLQAAFDQSQSPRI